MSFAKKLAYLRKKNNVTQKELAKIIGKTNRVISYYENEEYGSSIPSHDILVKIAEYFNVSVEWLLQNDSNQTPRDILLDSLIELTIENKLQWENYKIAYNTSLIDHYESDIINELQNKTLENINSTIENAFYTDSIYYLYKDAWYIIGKTELTNLVLSVAYINYNSLQYEEINPLIFSNSDKLEKLYSIIEGDKEIYETTLISRLITDLRAKDEESNDIPF